MSALGGMEPPQWSALSSLAGDLREAMRDFARTRQEMLEVTGTAWSDDRMVRVVVGPRGQLVELEIDPRAFRQPDSKALSAAILATARAAVEDANRKTMDVMDKALPRDQELGLAGGQEIKRLLGRHDADLPDDHGRDSGDGHTPQY